MTLEVNGKEEDVLTFVRNVKGSKKYETEGRDFDFNHFIPQPDNLFRDNLSTDKEKELKQQGIPDWYNWNVENWGTKWNAHCEIVDFNGGDAVFHLETAWADPRPVIHKMIEMYPNLSFIIEGEEESQSYGIYIDSAKDFYGEEEPSYVDEDNNRAVHWDSDLFLWRYTDNYNEVENSEDFYPQPKYSWS
jgi:hypothetical protein